MLRAFALAERTLDRDLRVDSRRHGRKGHRHRPLHFQRKEGRFFLRARYRESAQTKGKENIENQRQIMPDFERDFTRMRAAASRTPLRYFPRARPRASAPKQRSATKIRRHPRDRDFLTVRTEREKKSVVSADRPGPELKNSTRPEHRKRRTRKRTKKRKRTRKRKRKWTRKRKRKRKRKRA